jgi:hypothetical protein
MKTYNPKTHKILPIRHPMQTSWPHSPLYPVYLGWIIVSIDELYEGPVATAVFTPFEPEAVEE